MHRIQGHIKGHIKGHINLNKRTDQMKQFKRDARRRASMSFQDWIDTGCILIPGFIAELSTSIVVGVEQLHVDRHCDARFINDVPDWFEESKHAYANSFLLVYGSCTLHLPHADVEMKPGDYVLFDDGELHGVSAARQWVGVATQGAIMREDSDDYAAI